jgi:tRNA uridine 5-carboxymethylaminomethyl modification enzyme
MRHTVFEEKMERLEAGREILTSKSYTPKHLALTGVKVNQDGTRRTAFQLLAFPDFDFETLVALDAAYQKIDSETRSQLQKDALYANYIARQKQDVEMMKRDEAQEIPNDFSYESIEGLSNELKSKLAVARPSNLAQAARVDGVTPAALTLILARLRKDRRAKSA